MMILKGKQMAKSIFREYDIRGIYPTELNEQTVKKIGYYFAIEVKTKVADATYISVGYDARTHSPQLAQWLIAGINHAGLKVLSMGLVPTPVNYFSNFADFNGKTTSALIMITGSHNPPEYNGFKITIDKQPFFGEDIYALGDNILTSDMNIPDNVTSIEINAKELYINYLVNEFKDLNNGFDYDSEYEKLPKLFSTDEININTTEERKFTTIDELKIKLENPPADFPTIKEIITVDGIRVVFEKGWGLIRASNTTPKLVTRFEAVNEESATLYQEKLLELMEK
jgi:phosphomannomutase